MRVVFDVNVLIRATMHSAVIARVLSRSAELNAEVLTHDLLLTEFAECARKPRLAAHVDGRLFTDLLAFLGTCGKPVSIQPPFPPCRDPDDGYLLAMAQSGAADYLVTNDADLLCARNAGTCRILTPEDFLSVIDAIAQSRNQDQSP